MSPRPNEKAFENHFCHQLEEAGYHQRDVADVDKSLCLNFKELDDFLSDTQPEEMKLLKHELGQEWKAIIIKQIREELKYKKMFEILRDGIQVHTKHLSLLYTKPTITKDKDQLHRYKKNHFTFVRQYTFAGQESLDVILFLNGVALVTLELKNEPTGQNVFDAVQQYLERDLSLPVFNYPFLHIAADNNRVKTASEFKTKTEADFSDFNTGLLNEQPKNSKEYPVHYLYHDVLTQDSLLSFIETFLYKNKKKESVFPRFHQRRCTDRIIADIASKFHKQKKLDLRYLVQHSAGSGKSNTIVWLVQSLRNLHVDDKKLFDSIIVLTDRVNLDDQISKDFQQAIDQDGVANYVQHSTELAEAIKSETKVIVSKMQLFTPLNTNELLKGIQLADKRLCFVIDESHRSQEGTMHETVTETFYEQEELIDKIAEKKFPNAVFIALTATPSDKTLRHFGVKDGNTWKPFDVYTMDEAIGEGYILDVVKNLITYETLYELNYKYDSAKEYPPLQIYRALKQKAFEDDELIQNKIGIMLSIFENQTASKINGIAKAMIVTSSRLAAAKYKLFLDKEIGQRKFSYKALVAFTGTVEIDDKKYTESNMNEAIKISQSEKTEDAFDRDNGIRFIIVANKFQTGFNQPKLHTMFLDKTVRDINAVQTLSRLNRIYPDKEDTLVVDFTDSYDNIIKAFQKFQSDVVSQKNIDPDDLGKIYQDLLKRGLYTKADIKECVRLNVSEKPEDTAALSGLMSGIKDVVKKRYETDKEKVREVRTLLGRFSSIYNYVKTIFRIGDEELNNFKAFCDLLYRYLDPTMRAEELEAELRYVQVTKRLVRTVEYEPERDHKPVTPAGGRGGNVTYVPRLATVKEIVEAINETFKAMTGSDVGIIEGFINEIITDEELKADVRSNIRNDKEVIFRDVLQPKMEERYRNFVLDRAADRYSKLTQIELMTFVQRNAFQIMRQNAI